MYRCENCQNVVPPNTKAHRVVIETRLKRYPRRERANKIKEDGKIRHIADPGGIGYETVREITVCPECAKKVNQKK